MKLHSVLWLLGIGAVLRSTAAPELVDPAPKRGYALLAALAPVLPEMDFLQSWDSKSELGAYEARAGTAGRRLVAPLLAYAPDGRAAEALSDIDLDNLKEAWVTDFRAGIREALAAVHVPSEAHDKTSVSRDDFVELWKRSSKEQRVFISYAKQDHDAYAVAIRKALTAAGYVVYTYRSDSGEIQRAAREVGRLFVEAGHRIVVDSGKARQSLGVLLEARWAKEVEKECEGIRFAEQKEQQARLQREEDAKRRNEAMARELVESRKKETRPDRDGTKEPFYQLGELMDLEVQREFERMTGKHYLNAKAAVVEVYGRMSCPRTEWALNYLSEQGVAATLRDIDQDPSAESVLRAQRGPKKTLLPMIRIGPVWDVECDTSAIHAALDRAGITRTKNPGGPTCTHGGACTRGPACK